jgi:large subunit ribosomal protein L13
MSMAELYIDATNHIAGRLASSIVKELLRGNRVFVVNAEKAVISGNPKFVVKSYLEKIQRGDPYHGPFYPKSPERILRRIVRGMIAYKKPRGREAFKRLRVFMSVPEDLKGKEFVKIKCAECRPGLKSIKISEISKRVGAKIA